MIDLSPKLWRDDRHTLRYCHTNTHRIVHLPQHRTQIIPDLNPPLFWSPLVFLVLHSLFDIMSRRTREPPREDEYVTSLFACTYVYLWSTY